MLSLCVVEKGATVWTPHHSSFLIFYKTILVSFNVNSRVWWHWMFSRIFIVPSSVAVWNNYKQFSLRRHWTTRSTNRFIWSTNQSLSIIPINQSIYQYELLHTKSFFLSYKHYHRDSCWHMMLIAGEVYHHHGCSIIWMQLPKLCTSLYLFHSIKHLSSYC